MSYLVHLEDMVGNIDWQQLQMLYLALFIIFASWQQLRMLYLALFIIFVS
jgi:hypothetical protein